MNHITKLMQENRELHAKLDELRGEIMQLVSYYTSDKFAECDCAHVRTDVLPRLNWLYHIAICP